MRCVAPVLVLVVVLWPVASVNSFVPPCPNNHLLRTEFGPANHFYQQTERKAMLDPSVFESASSLTIADATWRQYVAFALISGVLLDIVLGSPLANIALKPLKGDEEDGAAGDDSKDVKLAMDRSKERIDTEQYAQAAIDRAQSALELRKFLDERKSDWEKMEEIKRKLDSEMQDLDEDLAAREEYLKKRKE